MKISHLPLVFALAALLSVLNTAFANGVDLQISTKGIAVGEEIIMHPPHLVDKDGNLESPTSKLSDDELTLEYPSGLQVRLEVDGDAVECDLSNVPADAKGLKFRFVLSVNFFLNGGKFAAGGDEAVFFPETADGQFVTKGSSKNNFVLTNNTGEAVEINFPANWYGLQDNRIFNNNQTFQLDVIYDFAVHPNQTEFEITFSRPAK